MKISTENYKQVTEDYDRYRFIQKTKHVVPATVGLLTAAATRGNSRDKAVNGFAAYGVMIMLEEMGIGLGKPISNMLYPVVSWRF